MGRELHSQQHVHSTHFVSYYLCRTAPVEHPLILVVAISIVIHSAFCKWVVLTNPPQTNLVNIHSCHYHYQIVSYLNSNHLISGFVELVSKIHIHPKELIRLSWATSDMYEETVVVQGKGNLILD